MGAVLLYTGNGGGKTAIALGLALRCAGHRKKVVMIQFMKGRKNIGEFKAMKCLPRFKVYQFGRTGFVNLKTPSLKDKELACKGLEFAACELKKAPDLLILDELCLAAAVGLVEVKGVITILKRIPKKTTVVLTGRYAPGELKKRANLVTEVKDIKPLKKIRLGKGISY